MIKAVVFDLDDTLFPEKEFVLSGFRAVDRWLKEQRLADGFYAQAQALLEAGIRGRIFDMALQQLGLASPADLVSKMVQVYRHHAPQLSPYADASEVVHHYRGYYKLGLITDGYLEVQKQKVTALALASAFDAIVYSDALGREFWKPSPAPFLKMMECLGLSGAECLYVGDNPLKDFLPARRLNWATVRIRRPGTEHFTTEASPEQAASYEVSTLLALTSVLKSFAQEYHEPV
jgi:putative hydrolase of the HAD superfamily